ncbi:hypothetical protein ACFWNK_19985 [Streptomyces sp. NPDC058417]|uniref:hypothetical protein n=1 Tax=unclassified Streptomyces TaxID=2593676 RepID=UPI00364E995A
MPTTSRPRSTAPRTIAAPRRAAVSRKAAALTALAAGGALLLAAPSAVAAPGDNGDITVHTVGAAPRAQAGQPRTCNFYLDAFNFDVAQGLTWTITPRSGQNGTTARLSGEVTLANGAGVTENLTLPTGPYQVTWTVVGGSPTPKTKNFALDCPRRAGAPGPNGGPPAGGGGLARDAAFTPVAGAAAVGLAAVGGAAWFRLRRRSHGAA